MRFAWLPFFVACAEPAVTPQPDPLTVEAPPPVAEAPTTPAPLSGAQVLADYLDAVCALHARPDCAASRAQTCDDGLVLSDPASCRDILGSTARACPGLEGAMGQHGVEVAACAEWLRTATCEEQPACSPEGPRDAQGPCAAVVARVRATCAGVTDPE